MIWSQNQYTSCDAARTRTGVVWAIASSTIPIHIFRNDCTRNGSLGLLKAAPTIFKLPKLIPLHLLQFHAARAPVPAPRQSHVSRPGSRASAAASPSPRRSHFELSPCGGNPLWAALFAAPPPSNHRTRIISVRRIHGITAVV